MSGLYQVGDLYVTFKINIHFDLGAEIYFKVFYILYLRAQNT